MIYVVLGLAMALAGSGCFYLASPHQRFCRVSWPQRSACVAGLYLLCGSLLLLAQGMTKLAATFTFLTALMLFLTLLPYAAALFSVRKGR